MQLTKEQQHIVHATKGHILVDATAGSGKTTTLIHCVQHAIKNGISPSQILMVTSTESAKQRLDELLHATRVQPTTFEALSRKIAQGFEEKGLLEEAQYFSEEETFQHLTAAITDAYERSGQSIENEDFSHSTIYLDALLKRFNVFKNTMKLSDVLKQENSYEEIVDILAIDKVTLVTFEAYENRRKKLGFRTSIDMVYDVVQAIEDEFNGINFFADNYVLILVDEFHDINEAQLRLLRVLAGKYTRVIAVGDAEQCINTALSADPVLMQHRFDEEFPAAQHLPLRESFRFGPHPALIINSLFKKIHEKRGKFCVSKQKRKTEIDIQFYESHSSTEVVDTLLKWESKGNPLPDAAILVREFAHTIPIESLLIQQKIPYQILGGKPFFRASGGIVFTRAFTFGC